MLMKIQLREPMITFQELSRVNYRTTLKKEDYSRVVIEWIVSCEKCSIKMCIVFMDGNNGDETRVKNLLEKIGWYNEHN